MRSSESIAPPSQARCAPSMARTPLHDVGSRSRLRVIRMASDDKDNADQFEEESAGLRQLLGFRGAQAADLEAPFNWRVRLQLTKPGTWIPLIWGVACGAAASGNYHSVWNIFGDAPTTDSWAIVGSDTLKALGAMVLAGPFLTGYTQTINDWYDRELDAVNEPYRPIPSGAISEGEVIFQAWFLLLGGLVWAFNLDNWAGNDWPVITATSAFGSFIAFIYSAPPLKLKANGWTGTYALGASYIALPWWCGHEMFDAASITPQEIVLTVSLSNSGNS
jgi:chlorophyll synthase